MIMAQNPVECHIDDEIPFKTHFTFWDDYWLYQSQYRDHTEDHWEWMVFCHHIHLNDQRGLGNIDATILWSKDFRHSTNLVNLFRIGTTLGDMCQFVLKAQVVVPSVIPDHVTLTHYEVAWHCRPRVL